MKWTWKSGRVVAAPVIDPCLFPSKGEARGRERKVRPKGVAASPFFCSCLDGRQQLGSSALVVVSLAHVCLLEKGRRREGWVGGSLLHRSSSVVWARTLAISSHISFCREKSELVWRLDPGGTSEHSLHPSRAERRCLFLPVSIPNFNKTLVSCCRLSSCLLFFNSRVFLVCVQFEWLSSLSVVRYRKRQYGTVVNPFFLAEFVLFSEIIGLVRFAGWVVVIIYRCGCISWTTSRLSGWLSSHVSVPECRVRQVSVVSYMPDIDTFSFSYMPADVMSAVMEVQ